MRESTPAFRQDMSGIKTLPLTRDERERLQHLYITHEKQGQSFIKTTPGNIVLPASYEKHKEQIYNLKLRKDDIFILTWPKNGTAWTLEMVWCIVNDCDFQKAKECHVWDKAPYLEHDVRADFLNQSKANSDGVLSKIDAMPYTSKRILQSHLHYCLLPPNLLDNCKVVTCIRNPKDTVVSYYYFQKLVKLDKFIADFETFFELFMENLVLWSPYWYYILEAWKRRDHPNLCLLFFEDMKKDLEGCIRKVAKFLQKDLTDEQVTALKDHLSFKKMKATSDLNGENYRNSAYIEPGNKNLDFFRKGVVGDWKNHFTEEMNKRMDEVIEKEFGGSGLEFRYD